MELNALNNQIILFKERGNTRAKNSENWMDWNGLPNDNEGDITINLDIVISVDEFMEESSDS